MKKTKKFIYLISPRKIKNNKFYSDLVFVFKSKKISFFQLRLKKESPKKIINIGKKIKKLCKRFNIKLIINDNPFLAKKLMLMDVILASQTQQFLKLEKY